MHTGVASTAPVIIEINHLKKEEKYDVTTKTRN